MVHLAELLLKIFRYQTDRFLLVTLCVLALIVFPGYQRFLGGARRKRRFWLGSVLFVLSIGLTVGLYLWRPVHGLSAQYYANASWSEDGTDLDRHFETHGRRVDRFLDFNPNDFNTDYPFSGKPVSVRWEGAVYAPADNYRLGVRSNFGAWLYVDDVLVEGNHQIDFGTPQARTYLREGWSYDEQWGGQPDLRFIWSVGERSEFFLAVDELTDYTLYVRCVPFTYEGSPLQKLTVTINDIEVETMVLEPSWKTYAISVPRSRLQGLVPGFFRVKFTYGYAVRPADILKNSGEQRQLGVAFDFAVMQKVTLLGRNALSEQELLKPSHVRRGFHQVLLKALHSTGINPYIQLIWQPKGQNKFTIIPEDYLLPKMASPETIQPRLWQERVLLGVAIISKSLAIILFGSLILIYLALPYCQKLWTREYLILLGICLFAFVVRVLFLLEINGTDPSFHIVPPGTDQLNYVFYARGILRGYWPSLSHQPFYFNMLISFYFAVCSMLVGENLLAIRLVTAVMTTTAIIFTYLIARRGGFNKLVAYLAAGLCACNGVLIMYDTSLLLEPLKSLLSLVALWLLLKLQARLSWRITISLGVCLGLDALARATTFLVMPLFVIWMLIALPGRIHRRIAHILVMGIMMVVTILPVTIQNYFSNARHPFVLITSADSGYNLWVGNNPLANGTFSVPGTLREETRRRIRTTGGSFRDEVIRYITAQPLAFLKLECKKLKFFWRGYEIANLMPYYLYRWSSKVLGLPWINFVLLGPLSIIGLFLSVKTWRKTILLYGYVGFQLGITLMFFALARYRMPAIPILSIFAAYTLWYLGQALRAKRLYQFGIIIGVFFALYFLLNYPDAARMYERVYGHSMPFLRSFRYWDLFFTY
jgi:hypothetical protein